jgi:anaerobic magnesium-protoporphyrin IX monomethyl ester cyclase
LKKDITLVCISMSQPRTTLPGPLYIAAVLEKAGYGVDFRDYAVKSYWDLDPVGFLSDLDDSADVIGLSCTSDLLPFAIYALKGLKQKQPAKTIVLGGAGPTGVAKEILESFPFVDIVVLGEGELTILEVMECLTKGEKSDLRAINGICYRDGEGVFMTPGRERIKDLDQLPFPLYERVRMQEFPLISIVFSRGCPYKCTFCDVAPMWKHRNYRRSIDGVISEIRFIKDKYGNTDFEFTDETFVLDRDEIMAFCERLRREQIEITWACTGRINLITDELLAEMAASGCKAIFYGIESGSDRVLEKVKKDFSAREAVEIIRKTLVHMHAVASFIWGFPFETEDDLLKTLLLMVYLSQMGIDTRLNRLAPFALTPLYSEYGDRLICFEELYTFSPGDPFQAQTHRGEIRDLIREFPSVFPEFLWFPADRLAEKSRLIESLSSHWYRPDWPPSKAQLIQVLEAS